MIRKSLALFISIIAVLSPVTRAQDSGAPGLAIEVAGARCMPIDSYPVSIATDECRVVEFGRLTEVNGDELYFARYHVTSEVPVWPSLRDLEVNANVLVLLSRRAGSDVLTPDRFLHEDFAEFARYSFPAPEILETSHGSVLHILRRGAGGGMQQWFNDEYWLWRSGDWQRLDVTSWYEQVNAYLPLGYSIQGVAYDRFDLVNLRTVSPVRKNGDPECCPSGGIVTVSFDWFDLALTIRNVAYDPGGSFD